MRIIVYQIQKVSVNILSNFHLIFGAGAEPAEHSLTEASLDASEDDLNATAGISLNHDIIVMKM